MIQSLSIDSTIIRNKMNITDEIRRIKYLRMKPEERFLYDILSNVEININNSKSHIFILNDKILFDHDLENDIFWVNYSEVWVFLIVKYNLDFNDIQKLIKRMMLNVLNIKVINPLNTNNITYNNNYPISKINNIYNS